MIFFLNRHLYVAIVMQINYYYTILEPSVWYATLHLTVNILDLLVFLICNP